MHYALKSQLQRQCLSVRRPQEYTALADAFRWLGAHSFLRSTAPIFSIRGYKRTSAQCVALIFTGEGAPKQRCRQAAAYELDHHVVAFISLVMYSVVGLYSTWAWYRTCTVPFAAT